ncbi:hypothetical protein [Plantactinospora sp. CA-290183]
MIARNPYLRMSAKVASDHGSIPHEDFRAVVDAVRETATAHDPEVG